ncbi:DUF4003 family protein [Cytobacillus dafuensis]|uniref:DUF4003 family protein n=1 Tax=Cytobacillus dafuensis TaxID=1742359 RepID=A0A5B8Z3S4_CYTDA|nr:DUF4003 family protein [Cytobacillus dafuensis]QED46259.1 DUF4003 family protein [Cytobacillus dafuensis]
MEKALLEENVEVLKQAVGSWMDRRLVLMTASQFAAKGKRMDGTAFLKVSDLVKKSTSFFSPLRSIYYPMTGLILANGNLPDEEVNRLHRNYETLRSAGFRSSVFTYIAAFLMEDHMDPRRINTVHEEMKKYHRFLTSHDDYPAAAIIAKQEGQVEELVHISEQYYKTLSENGFYKGNDLQFMANMLVMNGAFRKETVSNVIYAMDELSRSGLKVKQMHYSSLCVIALSGKLKEAISYALELRDMKEFKWHKDMAIVAAAVFVSQEYVDASTGLTAAIQALIQAQHASVAAASAAAAASAGGSSGS